MSAEPHAEEADDQGAWEYHEGEGPFAGWLFRYDDGTLVAQDGTVLEEARATRPEPVEPVEPVEPDRGPGDWVFHDGSDGHDGWRYHHADGRVEHEDGTPVDAPVVEAAETEAAAETLAPAPIPEEPARDERASRGADDVPHATLEPQPGPEPVPGDDEPVPAQDPEPEPAAEPVPAARGARGPGDWVFHDDADDDLEGWLYHHADGRVEREDGTLVEDADETPAPAPIPEEPASDETPAPAPIPEEPARDERASRGAEVEPEPEPAPEPVPAYLRWEASVVPQYLAGVVFAGAAIVAVVLLVDFLGDTDSGRLVPAVGLALLAGAALLALGSLSPTVVTLRGSEVEVALGEQTRTYDLADQAVRVDLLGSTSSLSWRARLRHPDGDADLLSRRQVDPREFSDAVRAHRPEA